MTKSNSGKLKKKKNLVLEDVYERSEMIVSIYNI